MKKVLLTLLILMGAMNCFAKDGDEFEYEGINYTVTSEAEKTCRTKEGSSSAAGNLDVSGELNIPSQVTNSANNTQYIVTEIGSYSFYNNGKIMGSLTLPSTITTIGDDAFSNCSGFKGSLTLPESLISIAANDRYKC